MKIVIINLKVKKKFNAIEYLNYLISESNNPSDIEKLEKNK